jgi:ribonuclease BN (tRNA processing enzyme)
MIHRSPIHPVGVQNREGWGHSSVSNATVFIQETGARDWIVTHHDPRHTDLDLLKKAQLHHDILEELDLLCRVRLAYDGMLFHSIRS